MLAAEDGMGRAGGGDDNVRAVGGFVELLKKHHLAAELGCQLLGVLIGAIGDEDAGGSVRHQVSRRQFAHLAGADKINCAAVQRTEDLFCELHGDGGHGNRRRAHGSFAAHALGNGKGARQQRIQMRVNGAHRACHGIGFLHLAEDLRLAHDHGIQTGSYAEEMANGLTFAEFVKVAGINGRIKLKEFAQKGTQVGAGGKDQALFDAGSAGEALHGLGQS